MLQRQIRYSLRRLDAEKPTSEDFSEVETTLVRLSVADCA
jgi:hypothetical protein